MVDLVDLETRIKQLPGVLGCVIFTNPDGTLSEIQAFTRIGTNRIEIRDLITAEAGKDDPTGSLQGIRVFELDAESVFGDRESLERAAEVAEQQARTRGPGTVDEPLGPSPSAQADRPLLRRVVLTTTDWTAEAQVTLGGEKEDVVGQATGEKTPHGLRVLAQATLLAVRELVPEADFHLMGASLVNAIGEEAVLVLVQLGEEGPDTVGAALVRGGPVGEAAVRATLDGVNRRLAALT